MELFSINAASAKQSTVTSYLVSFLVFYSTFSTNRLYHAIKEMYHIGSGENTNIMQLNTERIQ